MSIEFVSLYEIRVPFRDPLVTRDGTHAERRSILVRVSDGTHAGWGEAAAFPSGRFGTADEAWEALRSLDPNTLPAVPIASAAVQAARADMEARRAGVPLHRFLGGRRRAVAARHTVGLVDDLRSVIRRLEGIVSGGVRRIKVKVTPGADIEPVLGLRAAFPHLDIAVDANGSYDDPFDIAFDALDHLGVSVIDQPFPSDALDAHAALRRRGLTMQVCLDESIASVASAVTAMAAHAADIVSVKVGRMGFEASRAILASGRATGTGFKVGGTFDTAIGRRHLLAFATLAGVTDAEVAPPSGYLAADIAEYPALDDGTITPDDAPGIGVEPDMDRVGELLVRKRD
ncbi:MAG: enolase C-terminal domain-like protein [Acidimicrobiia bacterium]